MTTKAEEKQKFAMQVAKYGRKVEVKVLCVASEHRTLCALPWPNSHVLFSIRLPQQISSYIVRMRHMTANSSPYCAIWLVSAQTHLLHMLNIAKHAYFHVSCKLQSYPQYLFKGNSAV